jgi:hypothetical protein
MKYRQPAYIAAQDVMAANPLIKMFDENLAAHGVKFRPSVDQINSQTLRVSD